MNGGVLNGYFGGGGLRKHSPPRTWPMHAVHFSRNGVSRIFFGLARKLLLTTSQDLTPKAGSPIKKKMRLWLRKWGEWTTFNSCKTSSPLSPLVQSSPACAFSKKEKTARAKAKLASFSKRKSLASSQIRKVTWSVLSRPKALTSPSAYAA